MRVRVAIVSALALALLLPAASLGATATTYHGVFPNKAAVFAACPAPDWYPPTLATGNWNVVIVGERAEVHATVFMDMGAGVFHLHSFGGVANGQYVALPTVAGETFHVRLAHDKMWGNQIDFILRGEELAFSISPYFDCASGTSLGALR